jgi:ABC-type glycerol-3-phosphate transport system substrate-binding protein
MWKYTDDPDWAGAQIGLDSNIAIESFQYVTRLYSDYSFPVAYDAANRFRTGEMPILVGDYVGLYNQLIVYATEIDGLWEFCPLPGCEREDGTVNYDSLATITATVMLHGCEGEEQFAAWEYMQWQTSADVQAEYGNKMVALIGPSAKYATANINAIKNLSWTADEREAILDQIEHMSSIVNYPGSYYIARYVQFAFLDVVNDGVDASDALTSYISAINTEITRKRQEFGLNTWEGDELPPGYKPGTKQ